MVVEGIIICDVCGGHVEEIDGEPVVCIAVDEGSSNVMVWYDEHDCETDES